MKLIDHIISKTLQLSEEKGLHNWSNSTHPNYALSKVELQQTEGNNYSICTFGKKLKVF